MRLFAWPRPSKDRQDGARPSTCQSMLRTCQKLAVVRWLQALLCSMFDLGLHAIVVVTDFTMAHCGPCYVAVGVSLILAVSYVYLALVFIQLYGSNGSVTQAAHLLFGTFLLGNILLNYWLCISTNPGSTATLKEGYHLAAGGSIRYCKHCRRAKPAFAHHCHICQRCVLRMDHHCPWVNNCIGHANHRFFVLFVIYLMLGGAYAALLEADVATQAASAWARMSMQFPAPCAADMRWLILTFAISTAASFALLLLFVWHCYLILTAQTTVDFLNNWANAREARKTGFAWENPYDLGCIANWQEAFDAYGRLWWLRWLLPSLQIKRGNGMAFPSRGRSRGHESAASRAPSALEEDPEAVASMV